MNHLNGTTEAVFAQSPAVPSAGGFTQFCGKKTTPGKTHAHNDLPQTEKRAKFLFFLRAVSDALRAWGSFVNCFVHKVCQE